MAMTPIENAAEGLPKRVKIVEVGVRDGLQNEKVQVATAVKIALINRLTNAGIQSIEVGSFVSPKWVPQMADTAEVVRGLPVKPGVAYSVLVPNMRGLEQALETGCREVAVFAAASEAFSQKNINCSIAESLARFGPVIEAAQKAGVNVRGYVSCVMNCPFTGDVPAEKVAEVAGALYAMGCYEISLGDTTGAGGPLATRRMIDACARQVPVTALAGHFHDTYGMALANIYASLESGVTAFDSSVAGLGGCPYSPGATGNVATEDVVYLMQQLRIETGLDLPLLVEAGNYISTYLERPANSRIAKVLSAKQSPTITGAASSQAV
ncbi:hydroxymethylglutaryl-CoA lyase [Noviherbaspirillum sedimenti]|uniref:hydroxymethylglutaryl-CoA lyase n=1 Tax=Noviherbaspirillum sedimenti TaxID=2320865 RepID=A0A3A3G334_9BURK|nr:hydroxymethylglutaryl-CoA lyase [Noviherbaspirillum sedimenti]RJG02887.1 hydroxymethylglutaryl-CoA lyase [Noviherbaspirillum sedimenti]